MTKKCEECGEPQAGHNVSRRRILSWKLRGRIAGESWGVSGRQDRKAWMAGSTKRCMRFPGAADHEGGLEIGGISLVMLAGILCEFFLDSTLVKFCRDSFRLPENYCNWSVA